MVSGATHLVSLTRGPTYRSPAPGMLEIAWAAPTGTQQCLTASSTSRELWRMDMTGAPGQRRFRWLLSPERKADLESRSVGVLVRQCGAASASDTYRAISFGDTPNSEGLPYRAVLLSSSKLHSAYVTLVDESHRRREVIWQDKKIDDLGRKRRSRITLDIPPSNIGPGKYRVELDLRGTTSKDDHSYVFYILHQ